MNPQPLEQRIYQQRQKYQIKARTDIILPETSRDLLHRLDTFNAPYLEEKLLQKDVFNTSEEYLQHLVEFKKYVFLATITPENMAMTSPKVDEVWHQFILFTREYHAFCSQFVGRYLHHTPKTSHTPMNEEIPIDQFVKAYKTYFGEIPELWNISSAKTSCSSCCSSGCASCGSGPSVH